MRKLGEQEIRKLIKLNQSYGITLPIALIRQLGWKEKQKLEVKKEGNTLIIKDWEK